VFAAGSWMASSKEWLWPDANPTRVQKTLRHQHHATTAIYVEEVQKLLEGAEETVTQSNSRRTFSLGIFAS
jgi:hypothetical protein